MGEREPGAYARLRVGRVVEIRVIRLVEPADVETLSANVMDATCRAGHGAVICGDYRRAAPVSRQVANAWSRAMRSSNRAIVRSALLLDPANAMFNLQLERVVHCAGSPVRRVFSDVGELRDWLGDQLTESERDALATFLARGET